MQVELHEIHKTFGKVHANNGINLSIPAGTIQGILGENGAGKSTLMKILSGFIQADSGQVLLDGREAIIQSPADAIQRGIGMLHQDPLDFPPLKLIDNFMLGHAARSRDWAGAIFPERGAALRDFRRLAERFGFSLDPDAYVDKLTVGERQQLEILRLLWLGAHVLILDEPTTGISLPQKEKLFDTLKKLAGQGMTIIFVSHKLEDVEFLCSRIAVMRDGMLAGVAEPPYVTDRLVALMFGKTLTPNGRTHNQPGAGAPVLRLNKIGLEGTRLQIKDVSLEVRAGEIIGLAGMEGSGQALFLESCAGLKQLVNGKISLGESDLTGASYHTFKRHGAAYVPAARLEQGLIPGLTLAEHFILSEGMKGLFIDRERAARLAQERIKLYNIKGAPASPIESLSGGNQQRALLALLPQAPRLILLEHPTRGLDIESTIYVWSKLKERCAQGTAIIFISADLDEILEYSNRVLVFFAGRVSAPLDAKELSTEQLGQLIGGKESADA